MKEFWTGSDQIVVRYSATELKALFVKAWLAIRQNKLRRSASLSHAGILTVAGTTDLYPFSRLFVLSENKNHVRPGNVCLPPQDEQAFREQSARDFPDGILSAPLPCDAIRILTTQQGKKTRKGFAYEALCGQLFGNPANIVNPGHLPSIKGTVRYGEPEMDPPPHGWFAELQIGWVVTDKQFLPGEGKGEATAAQLRRFFGPFFAKAIGIPAP